MRKWLLFVVLLTVSPRLAVPPPAPQGVIITAEDKCKAWVLWDEARGEPDKGARAVLDVVHTRMKRRNKTACEVVKEHSQFQGYKPGVFQDVPKEALTRYEAVRRMPPSAPGSEYFHATYVHPAWRKAMQRMKQIGKHIFYKEKKHE